MARVLELRADDRQSVVHPCLPNGDLQLALAPHGLFWPPDPASADQCTVGGNLACNAGGPHAVKYGATRDNVLGLVAVTGSGEVIRVGSNTTKDATGYRSEEQTSELKSLMRISYAVFCLKKKTKHNDNKQMTRINIRGKNYESMIFK